MLTTPPSALSLVEEGVRAFIVWDFDGVLNPSHVTGTYSKAYYNPDSEFRMKNPHYEAFRVWGAPKEPKSHLVRYSSRLVQEVNELHADPTVQPIMLSTWRASSLELMERMGVTSERNLLWLPWGDADDDYAQLKKIAAFQKFFAGVNAPGALPVKLAWFDDEILSPEVLSELDPTGTSFTDATARLFCPSESYGVSREEMKQAATFLTPQELS